MPRKKFILFTALTALACIAALWLLHEPSVPDPEYNGKKLSRWWRQTTNFSLILPSSGDTFNQEFLTPEARQAIVALGTNALPFLWLELNAADSPAKQRLVSLLDRQPFQKFRLQPAYYRQTAAHNVLKEMGTNAAPLIPQLVPLLGDDQRSPGAAELLFAIGPHSLPALHEAVRHPSLPLRFQAVRLINAIDPYSTATFPVLIEAISQGQDSDLRNEALTLAIRFPDQRYEAFCTTLLHHLYHPGSINRAQAAETLRRLADREPRMFPLLRTSAAQTADPVLAESANFVLRKIAPILGHYDRPTPVP